MFKLVLRLLCLFCSHLLLNQSVCILWFLLCFGLRWSNLLQILSMALSSLALTRLWFLNISILRLCCLVHGVLLPTNTLGPLIILEGCFLTIYHMHALRLVWKHYCVVSALLLHIYHSHICLFWLSLNSLIWTLTCRFTKFVFELYNFLLNKRINYLDIFLVSCRKINDMLLVKFLAN